MAGPTVPLKNASDSYVSEKYPNRNYNNRQKLFLADGSAADTRYAYIYFGLPSGIFASTVTRGILRVYSGAGFSGSVTLTVQRVTAKFSANRVTWNNKPAVTSTGQVSVTKSGAASGTVWEFDITSMLQTIANGAAWYGLRISATGSAAKWLYSAQAADQYRPELDVAWSDSPDQPERLIPDNGQAVSVAKPTLQWDFVDDAGDQTLQSAGIRLFGSQSDADANSNALLDITVPVTEPEFDLDDPAASAWGGMSPDMQRWWRVRNTDGAGMISAWSDPATFIRKTKGTLTITNPSVFGTVDRTNFATHPRGDAYIPTTGNPAGFGNTYWHGTYTLQTGSGLASPLPDTYVRKTLDQTTPNLSSGDGSITITRANSGLATGGNIGMVATPGVTYTVSYYARQSRGGNQAVLQWRAYDSAGNSLNASTQIGAVTLTANAWSRVVGTFTTPANTAYIALLAHTQQGAGPAPVTGDTWDATGLLIEQVGSVGTYFDGDTTDTYASEYDWTGTVRASTSIHRGNSPYVYDNTPPFSWTFTGRTQVKYEVIVATPETPSKYLWRSGVVPSTDTAVTPPPGIIKEYGKTYRLIVRIYDDQNRVTVPDDPIYVEAFRDFVYIFSPTVSKVSNLVGTPDALGNVALEWDDNTAPDEYVFLRDGKQFDTGEAVDLLVSGTHYKYTDDGASPRKQHVWEVARKQNGATSLGNPTYTGTVKAIAPLLTQKGGGKPVLFLNPDVAADRVESSDIHYILGSAPPVLITQSIRGYEGSVSGVLAGNVVSGLTADTMLDNLEWFKDNPGVVCKFLWVNQNLQVVIRNITHQPISYPDGTIDYLASFDFFEVGF